MAALVEAHERSWRFWERVYTVRPEWSLVERELRAAGLPDVLAALPYQATRYDRDLGFEDCSAGAWALPLTTPGLEIRHCHLRGTTRTWSSGDAPPMDAGVCMVERCAVDERLDLGAATRVASKALAATWEATGHDAFLTLAAHATGPPEAVVAQYLLARCAYTDPAGCAFGRAPLEVEVRTFFADRAASRSAAPH
ncbi:MAG: hypothetical protein ABMA64_40075 [Myxococcota bacterium]